LAPSAICGSEVQPIWCSISRTKFSMRAAAAAAFSRCSAISALRVSW
jgi:hypothetical protein